LVRKVQLQVLGAWRSRRLSETYAAVHFGSIKVKISEPHASRVQIDLALGLRLDGYAEVIGAWVEPPADCDFPRQCLTDLSTRGVRDILVALTRDDDRWGEAMRAVFPNCTRCPPSAQADEPRTLPEAMRSLASWADPFKILLARLRRNGLKAHVCFRNADEAVEFLLTVLEPGSITWRVKSACWTRLERQLRAHFEQKGDQRDGLKTTEIIPSSNCH
jgi:hypothetical protein